jgi:hypothetical protein
MVSHQKLKTSKLKKQKKDKRNTIETKNCNLIFKKKI